MCKPLPQSTGGTTESSTPESLYNFGILGQKWEEDGERRQENVAGGTREGARGRKDKEAPETEEVTEVREKRKQGPRVSRGVERQERARETHGPCHVAGGTWLSKAL
ncbi:hypothetical protein NDU88_005471 [Pleurodeles waltl]|uniref:Uncharacterized protein n=1 Tax=Pleurodeles waltl TaxID=8319 RepID=A0AAV7MY51_PLEWA|nr:hypothetical protein NDU88_005471 [Pleurodeles waltl]